MLGWIKSLWTPKKYKILDQVHPDFENRVIELRRKPYKGTRYVYRRVLLPQNPESSVQTISFEYEVLSNPNQITIQDKHPETQRFVNYIGEIILDIIEDNPSGSYQMVFTNPMTGEIVEPD